MQLIHNKFSIAHLPYTTIQNRNFIFGYLANTFVFKKLDKKVSKALRQLKLISINTHYKVVI